MARKDSRGRNLKNGETQRKDGMYQYRYMDLDNKRKTVYSWKLVLSDKVPAGKKNDFSLREKEQEIEKRLLNGMNNRGGYSTLNDMFDSYIIRKRYKGRNLAFNTKSNYKIMWNKHIRNSVLGNTKLSNIRRLDIVQLYFELKEGGISYGTLTFYNKLISSVLNMAIDDNMLFQNPAKRALDDIEGKQEQREALTIAQQEELLTYTKQFHYNMYCKLVFLLDSMCRVSEFAGMTWEEIDMKQRMIQVDHQLRFIKLEGDEKMTYHITPTKSRKSRTIPMTDRLFAVLKDLKEGQLFQSGDYEVEGKKDFIFYTKTGGLLNDNSFQSEIDNIMKRYNHLAQAKIEHLTPHILRHTGCTRNAERGMDMKVLQYVMGHSNPQITNAIYNHVNPERASMEFQKSGIMGKNRA